LGNSFCGGAATATAPPATASNKIAQPAPTINDFLPVIR
jgi:hypothetical protein